MLQGRQGLRCARDSVCVDAIVAGDVASVVAAVAAAAVDTAVAIVVVVHAAVTLDGCSLPACSSS